MVEEDAPGVEATLLAGDPPRESQLALWSPEEELPGAGDELVLVLPAGSRVRRRAVPVRRVALRDVLDELLALPADAPVGASLRAWAVAVRLAVELVARGRLTPGVTPSGADTWRLGPLDPDDVRRQHQLAAALPASAHATPLEGSSVLRIPGAEASVAAFNDAVADLAPRTPAAPLACGHEAFATGAPRAVDGAADWFGSLGAGRARTTVTLRLEPPADAEGAFVAGLVLQSPDDPSLFVAAGELWDAPGAVLARFADAEETLLLTLRRAARVWPPLERLLRDIRPERLVLQDDECEDLLSPLADDLAAAGLWVQWPAELLAPLDVRPTISTPRPERVVSAGLHLDALLEWRASLDGVELSEAELEQLAAAKRSVIRLRGRWVRADPARLSRLSERRRVGAGAALGVALGGTLTVDGETVDAEVEGPLAELGRRLGSLDLARDRPEPPGLCAQLRPYQRRGLAWLAEMTELGLGGVLADDMGLGKTIQVLALHLDRRPPRPTLVVCPAGLIANWEHEAARFAPAVPVRRFHGKQRHLDDLASDEIVLSTYGVVRRDADTLAEAGWGLVVADEAQAVKNPHSRRARALRSIGADARFALTGTPVENHLSELWAICDWTTPGLLGPLERFRREVAIPVERQRDPAASEWLATLVRPFVLRRRKTDPGVAPDLPPKTETDRFVPLSAEQVTLYQAVVDESLEQIASAAGMARRGLVLKLLTSLKQVCNHPAQHLRQSGPLARRSGKLDAAAELLDIISGEGDAALVFTQYVEMGKLLEAHLCAAGLRVAFLHGSLGLGRRQELVERFESGGADVFVLSLKAGGTGLNLTRATHVVHYDRWWNPAVEDQASDRAWRIGQDRPVQVHRLICEDTLEERIATLLETKRDLAERVVGGGEAWVSELDDEALARLVSLSGGEGSGC
ncbi:MAG: DEAD/DEAH box helicase [Actinobacteria bacterium]|nr:MAG: DEAD/DEAH box helicase [Actinomycetota bacterium]